MTTYQLTPVVGVGDDGSVIEQTVVEAETAQEAAVAAFGGGAEVDEKLLVFGRDGGLLGWVEER